MFYKKFSFICLAALLSAQAAVCSATVPQDVDNGTKPKVLNQKLLKQATKKADKQTRQSVKAAKKQKQQAGSISIGDTSSAVVSTKPTLAKNMPQSVKNEGTIKTPSTSSLLQERDGKYYFLGTELPEDYRSISIYGDAVATKTQAIAYIKQTNPEVKLACTVEELVDLYWKEAEREQVRPDLALAQSLVETATYKYGGDVLHHQNNFCGLAATGGGARGATFTTPELGVRAHIQHLLAYTQRQEPSTAIVDPRYDVAHRIRMERGIVDKWYGLNGTWAMGSLYCEKIMATYQKIRAMQVEEPVVEKKTKDKKKQKKSMKQKVQEILKQK